MREISFMKGDEKLANFVIESIPMIVDKLNELIEVVNELVRKWG